jgi:hypothetical protein
VFKVFDPDSSNTNFNIVGKTIIPFKNYYIISSSAKTPENRQQDYLTALSPEGNLLKSRAMNNDSTENWLYLRPIKSETQVTYPVIKTEYVSVGAQPIRRGGLMRVDTALSILWDRDLKNTAYPDDFVSRIVQTTDSGYLLNISIFKNPNYPNERILKTDKQGYILWYKEIPYSLSYSYSGDFVQTHDGNYLTAAYTNNLTPFPPFGFTQRVVLTKITPEADVLWQKEMQPIWRGRDLQPYLAPFPNGDIGYLFVNDSLAVETGEEWRLYLLDSLANVKWQTDFREFTVYKAIYRINSAANGDIIGCGIVVDTYQDGHEIVYGWVFRISKTGERLWSRFYSSEQLFPNSRRLIFHDIEETSDGRLALTGFVEDFMPPGKANPILAVLDENGCLDPANCNGTGVNIITGTRTINSHSGYKMGVSPNPSSGDVVVSLPEVIPLSGLTLEVRSITGQTIIQRELSHAQTRIDLSTQPSGLYFFVLRKSGLMVDHTKITVNH